MSGSLNGFPHELSSELTVHVGHLWDETFTFSSMGRKVFLHEPKWLYKLWTESMSLMELQIGCQIIFP
jgi:hypothetical protein